MVVFRRDSFYSRHPKGYPAFVVVLWEFLYLQKLLETFDFVGCILGISIVLRSSFAGPSYRSRLLGS